MYKERIAGEFTRFSSLYVRARPEERQLQLEAGSQKLAVTYFAASWAHFAKVDRKGFAGAGGSTSPVNAALKVTMCP